LTLIFVAFPGTCVPLPISRPLLSVLARVSPYRGPSVMYYTTSSHHTTRPSSCRCVVVSPSRPRPRPYPQGAPAMFTIPAESATQCEIPAESATASLIPYSGRIGNRLSLFSPPQHARCQILVRRRRSCWRLRTRAICTHRGWTYNKRRRKRRNVHMGFVSPNGQPAQSTHPGCCWLAPRAYV